MTPRAAVFSPGLTSTEFSTYPSGPPQGDPSDSLDLLQPESLERLSGLLLVPAELDRDRVGGRVVDGEIFDGHNGKTSVVFLMKL